MSLDVRALFLDHKTFYEVWPYYVLLDEHPVGQPPVRKRVQAGFDIELYAVGAKQPLQLTEGDADVSQLASAIEEAVRQIVPAAKDHSEIQILPFEDSIVLDTHRSLRPEALVRIRVTHHRGLEAPEGPAEESALAQIRKTLRDYGVREGGGAI